MQSKLHQNVHCSIVYLNIVNNKCTSLGDWVNKLWYVHANLKIMVYIFDVARRPYCVTMFNEKLLV